MLERDGRDRQPVRDAARVVADRRRDAHRAALVLAQVERVAALADPRELGVQLLGLGDRVRRARRQPHLVDQLVDALGRPAREHDLAHARAVHRHRQAHARRHPVGLRGVLPDHVDHLEPVDRPHVHRAVDLAHEPLDDRPRDGGDVDARERAARDAEEARPRLVAALAVARDELLLDERREDAVHGRLRQASVLDDVGEAMVADRRLEHAQRLLARAHRGRGARVEHPGLQRHDPPHLMSTIATPSMSSKDWFSPAIAHTNE